jgi:hypothetical protein
VSLIIRTPCPGALIATLLLSCSPTVTAVAPPPRPKEPAASPECIVVGEDASPVVVSGTLRPTEQPGTLVLRLIEPRCVIGAARASVLTEVMLVSDGFDLRPLVGDRIRATGHALADASTPEGPAVIIVARSVERLPAKNAD